MNVMACIELSLWDDSFSACVMPSTSAPAGTAASPALIDDGIGKVDAMVDSVLDFDLSDEEDFQQVVLRAGFSRWDMKGNICHICPFVGLCDDDSCGALLFNTDVAAREYDPDAAEESYLSFLYQ